MSEEQALSRRELLRGRLFGRFAGMASKELEAAAQAFVAPVSPAKPGEVPSGSCTSTAGRRYSLPIHRPPGAVDEAAFLAGCTRCNDCITACPASAIVHAPGRFREAAGTPMIDPHTSPCVMCENMPCISACKPGALRADQPRKMGVAWIQTMACLSHIGSFCSVCSERCPVPGAVVLSGGRPTILADKCTGCGVCANVCPAPMNAIVIMPLADRPANTHATTSTRSDAPSRSAISTNDFVAEQTR